MYCYTYMIMIDICGTVHTLVLVSLKSRLSSSSFILRLLAVTSSISLTLSDSNSWGRQADTGVG